MRVAVSILLLLALTSLAALTFAYWSFGSSIHAELAALESSARTSPDVITEQSLEPLPEPARRYLRHAGVVGTKTPRLVHLTQQGRIRSSAEAQWMTFEAVETYSTSPPAFLWRAYFPTQATPFVLGRDVYLEGKGGILMKMAALLPVADERGSELDAAGLMRYLNEMSWFPAAFLGANVEIGEGDENSFSVRIADRGLSAEAVMFVDGEGRMTNFTAQRFNTGSGSIQTWETPITDYADYSGFKLPKSGSAVWRSPQGDLTYIELDVTGVTYGY